MRSYPYRWLALLILNIALSCCAGGGTAGSGGIDIDGRILDERGRPLSNIQVHILDEEGVERAGSVTDERGIFRVPSLPFDMGTVVADVDARESTRVPFAAPDEADTVEVAISRRPDGPAQTAVQYANRPPAAESGSSSQSGGSDSSASSSGSVKPDKPGAGGKPDKPSSPSTSSSGFSSSAASSGDDKKPSKPGEGGGKKPGKEDEKRPGGDKGDDDDEDRSPKPGSGKSSSAGSVSSSIPSDEKKDKEDIAGKSGKPDKRAPGKEKDKNEN